jgi:Fe-S cluster assembly iron-binding protein IscA
MLEVTETAVEKLKEYLQQNNISSAVRVALMQGG